MKYIGTTPESEEALRKRIIQLTRENIRVTQNSRLLDTLLRTITNYANAIEKIPPITQEQSVMLQRIVSALENNLLPKIKNIIGSRKA